MMNLKSKVLTYSGGSVSKEGVSKNIIYFPRWFFPVNIKSAGEDQFFGNVPGQDLAFAGTFCR